MCSRYELTANPHRLVERFDLSVAPPDLARAEIRPTDASLVITADGGRRGLALSWGLASWDGKPLINARAETLTEKKSFRPLLERRCLVPATAYFEWRHDGKRRLKNRVVPADGGIVSFAGLRDDNRFVIVTCPAAPDIAGINDRMPVILNGDAEDSWLDPTISFEAVAWTLLPFGGALNAREDLPPPPRQADLFG